MFRKVPRGNQRQELKDTKRSKTVMVKRQINAAQIKAAILKEFVKDFPSLRSFAHLECESNNFLKHSCHFLDGNAIANKRGILYVCEGNNFVPQQVRM